MAAAAISGTTMRRTPELVHFLVVVGWWGCTWQRHLSMLEEDSHCGWLPLGGARKACWVPSDSKQKIMSLIHCLLYWILQDMQFVLYTVDRASIQDQVRKWGGSQAEGARGHVSTPLWLNECEDEKILPLRKQTSWAFRKVLKSLVEWGRCRQEGVTPSPLCWEV